MKVIVGSQNPVKINATKKAFEKVWPDDVWQVEGTSVSSGVSDQPMSDVESIKGATTRAQKCLKSGEYDFAVGLEGGVQQIDDLWFDCGWIVVVRKDGIKGIGSTARMLTPQSMVDKLLDGMELGDVIDEVFDMKNSKQAEGHFGIMTQNAITRTKGYMDGVIMALARFITPEVF